MRSGKIRKYTELSNKYLNDAKMLLKDGDLAQTSEKFWGAFVTIVSAAAAKRDKQIKTHDGVLFFLTTISNELKDESLHRAGLSANVLHQNFYENSLTIEIVREDSKTIQQFINRIKTQFSLN